MPDLSTRRSATATDLDPQSLREELARLRPLAELGRMAATVAHEVRNPLAGISANAELVREALTDPADQHCVDVILGEVDRLGRLVTDLLFYSRERDAALQPMDLVQLARSADSFTQAQAGAAGVRISVHGNGRCHGDPELSRQAVLNVVRNAVEACREGGEVRLVVTPQKIEVIDQGRGVPEPLRARLFEPFVTGRTRGLGLGAAVAQRCMQRQGGDLVLARTGDDGSLFVLSWPDHA